MPPTRAARIERVLSAVPAEDVEWVAAALLTKAERRARSLDSRDPLALECFALLPALEAKPAARLIEVELCRFLASGWLLERSGVAVPPDPPGLAGAVRRLARANGGKKLGARQLLNLLAGARDGAKIT